MMLYRVLAAVLLCAPAWAGTFIVTNTDDSGEGSLRAALTDAAANDDAELDDIFFAFGLEGVIQLQSELPPVSTNVLLSTSLAAKGVFGNIVLDGTLAGDSNGLVIAGDQVIIEGLTIVNFQRSGIYASGEYNGIQILSCKIGTDGALCLGNHHHGILFEGGITEATIGSQGSGNLISGNGYDGIRLLDSDTIGTFIQDNLIGTDASGFNPIGNGWRSEAVRGVWTDLMECEGEMEGEGIALKGTPKGVTDAEGVRLVDGRLRGGGITVAAGSRSHFIGGSAGESGNIISGNFWHAIKLAEPGTSDITIQGNFIGVDVSGMDLLPNEEEGVHVRSGPTSNTIGGTFESSGNVIGGNNVGIKLDGPGVTSTDIVGNFIGVGTDGEVMFPIPNRVAGILIEDGPTDTRIGDGTTNGQNYVWHNEVFGVQIVGPGSLRNSVRVNSITANLGEGLVVRDGANAPMQAPQVLEATEFVINGSGGFFENIDVYADAEDEGDFYLGTTTTSNGIWFINDFPLPPRGSNITAIATDAEIGGSSEFSEPVPFTFFTAEGEGEAGGEAPDMEVDFIGDFNTLLNNPLLGYVPEPYNSMVSGLSPDGDYNGGATIAIPELPSDNPNKGDITPMIAFKPNGIPDHMELMVIEQLIENPQTKLRKGTAMNIAMGYQSNLNQLKDSNLGPNLSGPAENFAPGLLGILTAYSLSGEGEVMEQTDNTLETNGPFGTLSGVFTFINTGVQAFGGGTLQQPNVQQQDFMKEPDLGPNGDLAGDGLTNLEEWEIYGDGEFLDAVLDPALNGEGEAGPPGGEAGEPGGEADGPDGEAETPGGEAGGGEAGGPDGEAEEPGGEAGQPDGEAGEPGGEAGTDECDDEEHAADVDQSGTIELSEILRVIQFYNSNAFSCASETTEDGYEPGTGSQDCCPHDADYLGGSDFVINLSELLRMIQLYNSNGFTYCEGLSEDDFCPVV